MGKYIDYDRGVIHDEEIIKDIKRGLRNMNFGKYILYGIAGIIALMLLTGSFVIVGAGQRGAIMDFGRIRDNMVLNPGMHVVIPIYNTIALMDVQTQVYEVEATAASKDLQDAKTRVALNYHIVPETSNVLYRDVGIAYGDRLIAPAIQEVIKASTAKFTAEELITRREDVKNTIQQGLTERLNPRGIVVEQISITNFEFGQQFAAAIEQKVTAQQLALKAENDLTRIKIEAQQKVASAEGEKQSTILIAEGKSREIQIIQEQLKVSPQYTQYLAVREWNGVLPYVTGGNIPLISIPTGQTTTTAAK